MKHSKELFEQLRIEPEELRNESAETMNDIAQTARHQMNEKEFHLKEIMNLVSNFTQEEARVVCKVMADEYPLELIDAVTKLLIDLKEMQLDIENIVQRFETNKKVL